MKVKVHAFIGGTAVKTDIKNVNDGVQVIVGTPGRVIDMLKKKIIKLDYLKIFALDEADEMLSRGFLDNIKEVFPVHPYNQSNRLILCNHA